MKKKRSLFITCLSRTQTALLCGLGWRFGIKRADMYGTMENCLTVLFPSSGSATCQDVFMKINASKSWKMAGNSRNVARKTNISSVRDPKVSCSCWELGIKNVGEAPIVRGMTGVQVIFDHLGRFPNTLKWSALELSHDHMKGGSHPFFTPLSLMFHNFGCSACMEKPQSETRYLTLHLILEYVLLTSPLP